MEPTKSLRGYYSHGQNRLTEGLDDEDIWLEAVVSVGRTSKRLESITEKFELDSSCH